jgi:NAD(P)-dependent dehydrogenase (short-subunit alcohol dehydrogenase family)
MVLMAGEPRVVLVSGSSSGFGLLIAKTLARRGHAVYACMRVPDGRNAPIRDEVMALAGAEGIDVRVVELDVTDDVSVTAAVERVVAERGRLDVVVNNAGNGTFGLNETFTIEQVQSLFDVNVFGAARLNRAALPYLRRQGDGLLVQMSSVLGRIIWPFTGWYAATKHALEAMAESYRYDLATLGVDSVIVEPGSYPTRMTSGGFVRPADRDRVGGYGELGALPDAFAETDVFGTAAPDPQEVADAVANLIDMPKGSRPLRTLVGTDAAPLAAINDASANAHAELYRAMGIGQMLAVAPDSPTAQR